MPGILGSPAHKLLVVHHPHVIVFIVYVKYLKHLAGSWITMHRSHILAQSLSPRIIRGMRNRSLVLLAAWCWLCLITLPITGSAESNVTFFVIGDPQINIPRWGTAGTEKTIELMNQLPGKSFPFGGEVAEPHGVIIAGDLVDDLKNQENWIRYKEFFDPHGKARLRFKVFEGLGNHDLSTTQGFGTFNYLQKEFVERNKSRADKFQYDKHFYHYSWNWEPLHLVCLNIFPGNEPRPVYDRAAPWNDPKRSLDFLTQNLKTKVGNSGQPVILVWHYGLRGWGLEKWWKPEDLVALREVIKPYNVVLILHGHEHRYDRYEWEGYPAFMAPAPQIDRDPKTPEIDSQPKGFLVIRLAGAELQVAHHTAQGWAETWSRQISLGNTKPEK